MALVWGFIILFLLRFLFELDKNLTKQNKKEKAKNKTKDKGIYVIDVSVEMKDIIKYLSANYQNICNYEHINKIKETERLELLQWIWQRWDKRITNKAFKNKFPQYDLNLIKLISVIETGRIYAYYWQQEFKSNYVNSKIKPLVWVSYVFFKPKEFLCTIEDIPTVYKSFTDDMEEGETYTPDFLACPFEYFIEKCEFEYLNLWDGTKFFQIKPKELKEYCKMHNLGFPFKS